MELRFSIEIESPQKPGEIIFNGDTMIFNFTKHLEINDIVSSTQCGLETNPITYEFDLRDIDSDLLLPKKFIIYVIEMPFSHSKKINFIRIMDGVRDGVRKIYKKKKLKLSSLCK
ncbi:MAG: hypothetical protein ACKVQC_05520 [Elusimicrobiota bacterium]